MFVNELLTYLTCAYLKQYKVFNVKSSTYYFHMMIKVLTDFEICISIPLKLGIHCKTVAVQPCME